MVAPVTSQQGVVDTFDNQRYSDKNRMEIRGGLIMQKLTCLRCGHTWYPRIEKPVQCPRCKTLAWNKPRKTKRESD